MPERITRSLVRVIAVVALGVSAPLIAHEAAPPSPTSGVAANEGHVADGAGNVVTSGSGQCVTTSIYDKDKHGLVECGEVPPPAPEEPEPAPVAAPVPVPVTETVTLSSDVLFDFDKAVLKPEGKAVVGALARDWRSRGGERQLNRILLIGHTDSAGSDQYNQGLSERRARAVEAELVSMGVDPALIAASGRGESEPIASNETAEGRAKNRRVEIRVEGTVTEQRSSGQ